MIGFRSPPREKADKPMYDTLCHTSADTIMPGMVRPVKAGGHALTGRTIPDSHRKDIRSRPVPPGPPGRKAPPRQTGPPANILLVLYRR